MYSGTAAVVRRARYRRSTPGLGVVPVALAAGVTASLTKAIFGSRGASLPEAMAHHKAFIDALAQSGDLDNLRLVALGGTPTKVTPPWNVRVNYGASAGGAKDPTEFPAYRAYAAALVSNMTHGGTTAYVPGTTYTQPTLHIPAGGTPSTGQTAADLVRQAVVQGVIDPSVLDQVARGALSVADAARQAAGASRGAQVGATVGGALTNIPPMALLAGGAILLLVLRRK